MGARAGWVAELRWWALVGSGARAGFVRSESRAGFVGSESRAGAVENEPREMSLCGAGAVSLSGWPRFPASCGLGLPGIRPLDPVVAGRPRSAGAAGGDERSIPGAGPVVVARWAGGPSHKRPDGRCRASTPTGRRAGAAVGDPRPGTQRETPTPPRAGQGLWPCCGQSESSLSGVRGAVLIPLNVARGRSRGAGGPQRRWT